MGEPPKARPLRTRLIVLVCAVLLPMGIFSGAVVWIYTWGERADIEGALRVAGHNLALSVDAQFAGYATVLQTLATSASLDSGDLAGFHRAAVRARAANPDWLAITLADPAGQLLVSSVRPFGERLPQANVPDLLRRVIETGRPAVSDLFFGPISRELLVVVAVPVARDGPTRYILTAAVSPARLSDALARRRLPPGWTAAILDRRHVTVARMGEPPERLGEPVPPDRISRISTAGAGAFLDTTPGERRVYTAVSQSPMLGWTVLLHVPAEEFAAPLRRSLLLLGAGGLVLTLLAVLLALRVGGRIAGSLASLAGTAAALGRGEAIRRASSSITEVEQVARALEGAAAERTQAEASLREKERFHRSLMENALDMVTVIDAAGRIVYESPATTRILGFTPEERVSQSPMDLIHPDDLPAVRERLAERFRVAGTPLGGQFRIRHRDGSWRHLETVGQVFVDERGVALAVINSRDVTDQTQAEAQLRQAQKVEAIGQLAGGIAHDFNNLLTVILGRSQLLEQQVPAESPGRRNVELIRRTAERAAALTGQLLAFSRRQVLAPRVVDLTEVVQGMAQMLQRLIGEDIELAIAPGAGLWPVQADPHQLEQVVMNLAINARDAMPQGGRLRVETANVELDEAFAQAHPGAAAGPHACLTVSDTGVGMDEATRMRVFEPFFTTKEVGKGTGLGLSTVYGIVKQHGGYIEIESAPGRGATFRIYLPRSEAPAEGRAPGAAGAGTPDGAETILLVEDDAEVRGLAREILAAAGYTVLEAGHPAEAAGVLAGHPGPIHLLLSDVVMPGMSGPQLAAQLTAERPGLRVLFISGYTADALGPRGALAPGTALLPKPFTAEALARGVREALDRA